jgi:outer membrane biosynthesis protein TonB
VPSAPATLPELVDQLGRTFSPFERLKILIRAWSLLRQMTPEQRMIVASQLGLEHADDLVEAIARRSGTQASPALLSMIERAQTQGTAHLPQLLSDLRDPGKRAERMRQGAQAALEGAGSALAGETPAAPWLPAGTAAPPKATKPAAPAPAAPRPQAPPPPPAAAAPKPAAPPPPIQAPAPAAAPTPAPLQPAPPPAAAPAAPPPKPKPAEAAPPATPKLQPAPAAVPELHPTPVHPAEDGALAGRLADASSLTERFHVLRRHLGEAKRMPAEGLRSVVEAFPDGWARRRALVALLRFGVPASFRDALALVDALGSERDRLWCLGALTGSRKLSESDREALLAAAASPTARRRLEARLGEG